MPVYKGCALDLIHEFRSYGNSGLVSPESTVAEAPLGNLGEGVGGDAGWLPTPAADIIGKCHARLSEKSAQPKLICRLRISRLLQTAAEWAPL